MRSNLIKLAANLSDLRKMWKNTVAPRYARQGRSYSKFSKRARDKGLKHKSILSEQAYAKKLGFTPTESPYGELGKYHEEAYRQFNPANAILPSGANKRKIKRGKGLVSKKELGRSAMISKNEVQLGRMAAVESGPVAGVDRVIAKAQKRNKDTGGVINLSSGSMYANLMKEERAQQKALNRLTSKANKTPKQYDMSLREGLTGEDQEIFNRLIGGHEAREVSLGAKRNKRFVTRSNGSLEDAEFETHALPSVILKNDLNIANTLPEKNVRVKQEILRMRKPEIQKLQELLPEHRATLQKTLEGKRLSRNEIRGIDDAFTKKRGFKKRGRASLRKLRQELKQNRS